MIKDNNYTFANLDAAKERIQASINANPKQIIYLREAEPPTEELAKVLGALELTTKLLKRIAEKLTTESK